MKPVKGLMTICARCGAEHFSKYLHTETRDGGFGDGYERYEDLPEGWDYISGMGYLCPECAEELKNEVVLFFAGYNAEKNLAPCWYPKWMKDKQKEGESDGSA